MENARRTWLVTRGIGMAFDFSMLESDITVWTCALRPFAVEDEAEESRACKFSTEPMEPTESAAPLLALGMTVMSLSKP